MVENFIAMLRIVYKVEDVIALVDRRRGRDETEINVYFYFVSVLSSIDRAGD